MKTKLKKWHIVLMSLVALVFAIFTSLFNLKADPVDDETGEILLDNWNLDVVFYDSTVDNGKTPLTEINWDGSNGSYTAGTARVITVQINYKNTNAVTTYQPGELEIGIPNLIYSNGEGTSADAMWSASAIVGANDSTHTGFDWNFASGTSPSRSQEYYYFSNANTIEANSNFEGTIQIQYSITPAAETAEYTDECIHNYIKTLKANIGKAGERIFSEKKWTNTEIEITSPNWPNNYNSSMSIASNYWEYTSPTLENLSIYFDSTSMTESGYDKIYIYDKTGACLYTLSGTEMAGKTYNITGNYVKIAMSSDGGVNYKGFKAIIGSGELEWVTTIPENLIYSNEITMNYTRTYVHPWQEQAYTIRKTANKLSSMDGLPEGEYFWVKYTFNVNGYASTSYPRIGAQNQQIKDTFPEGCIVLDESLNIIEGENNTYTINQTYWSSYYYEKSLYVGYPKSIYNDENNNYNITNHVDLYVKYNNKTEFEFESEAEVSLNLADFEFKYSGDLYGITKYFTNVDGRTEDYNKIYSIALTGQDTKIGNGGTALAEITPSVIYTGKEMDLYFGDDLLCITGTDNAYRRLSDLEYYYSYIYFPGTLKNGNNLTIANGKYNCELWVRYAGEETYSLYEEFTSGNGGNTSSYDPDGRGIWSLTKEQAVVAYYFVMKDVKESILFDRSYYAQDGYCSIVINSATNIAESGSIYNFAFLKVFVDGVLQNAPTLDSYANMVTKEEIATYDLSYHGSYVQRAASYVNYYKYDPKNVVYTLGANKTMSITQDAANERFVGSATIQIIQNTDSGENFTEYEIQNYGYLIPEENMCVGWEMYDLLPEGMVLTSTIDEMLETLSCPHIYDSGHGTRIFLKDGTLLTNAQFKNMLKENITIEITENWRSTNRTFIYVKIDLTDNPIFFNYAAQNRYAYVSLSYNFDISYDAYLEQGNVWKNTLSLNFYQREFDRLYFQHDAYACYSYLDDGSSDPDLADINNNGRIDDYVVYGSAQSTLNAIISTHQDVTKYVKTDLSGYSTGIVDVSNNTEYSYKLRVRSGQNNITNLIIYDSIETAQPERTRWQGEFVGIDLSFARNKVHKLYDPENSKADSKGYVSYNVNVKPYWSENPDAGDLYLEDGTLNPDYQEYIEPIISNGVRIKFDSDAFEKSGVFYVYYKYNKKWYQASFYPSYLQNGDVIEIPSTEFYFYYNDYYSGCNFKIKEIEKIVTTALPGYEMYNYTPVGNCEVNENEYIGQIFESKYDGTKVNLYHYTSEKGIVNNPTDTSKVKSLAFEYLDAEGNPAVLPSSSITYVEILMKSPVDENITTLARNTCRTQWTALDEFDRPVDFVTGINSNVVKVALPKSVKTDDLPSISLRFVKEIQGTDSQFDYMQLDKAAQQTFMIRLTDLTANEDGTYNQVTALLKSNQELIISQIPVGTYLLEELSDNYFDFVDFTNNNDPEIIIEGVTLEKTLIGYILTVSEDLSETVEFNIKVTNEIEQFRPYEDKNSQENLFLKNKIEENS